jgi:hypothetical protein
MSDTKKHTLNPDKWIVLYADYLFNYVKIILEVRLPSVPG